jgi:hypothetical protein
MVDDEDRPAYRTITATSVRLDKRRDGPETIMRIGFDPFAGFPPKYEMMSDFTAVLHTQLGLIKLAMTFVMIYGGEAIFDVVQMEYAAPDEDLSNCYCVIFWGR